MGAARGSGWQRVRIAGPDDGSGGTITEELTIVAPGADGPPLPPTILEDLADENDSPHIIADRVVDELQISEAQGSLTPRLAAIAEPEDPPSPAARLFGRCSNQEKRVTKSIASHARFSQGVELVEGLRGEFEIGGEIDVTASADVRMTQKRYAIFGKCVPYAASFESAQLDGQLSIEKGARVSGRLEYSNHWQKRLARPYLGGVWIPAGPVPVWVEFRLPIDVGLDISARVEAGLTYRADETASGSFSAACASGGCNGSASWNLPQRPVSELVDASLEGDVQVDPCAEVGLQAALYHEDLVSVGVGLRPTLQAHVWGYVGSACGEADQDGSNETVRALMGDLGATVYLTGTTRTLGRERRSPDLWHYSFHVAFANLLNDWSAAQPIIAGRAITSPIEVVGPVARNLSLDPGVTATTQSTYFGYSPLKVIDGDPSTALGEAYSWANEHDTGPDGRLRSGSTSTSAVCISSSRSGCTPPQNTSCATTTSRPGTGAAGCRSRLSKQHRFDARAPGVCLCLQGPGRLSARSERAAQLCPRERSRDLRLLGVLAMAGAAGAF